jgi:hypothetical protein
MSTPLKKIVNLKADLLSNSAIHSGIIENFIKNTLYVRAVSKKPSEDLAPGKLLSVNFQVKPGNNVSLLCKVKWAYKTPPHGITESLGMEVLHPDNYYSDLLDAL